MMSEIFLALIFHVSKLVFDLGSFASFTLHELVWSVGSRKNLCQEQEHIKTRLGKCSAATLVLV